MFKKSSLIVYFCLLLISNSISAEAKSFNIDNRFFATFPTKPIFIGEITTKFNDSPGTIRSYASTDEDNLIVYNGTVIDFGTTMSNINTEEEINTILRFHATGNLLANDGKLESYKTSIVNGFPSAIFSTSYKAHDLKVNKYSVVTWSNGYLLSWSVQGSSTRSNLSAKNIFSQHLNNFKIIKDNVNISLEEKNNLKNQKIILGGIRSILDNPMPHKAYKSDDGIIHIQPTRDLFMKIIRNDGTVVFTNVPDWCMDRMHVKTYLNGCVLEVSAPLLN